MQDCDDQYAAGAKKSNQQQAYSAAGGGGVASTTLIDVFRCARRAGRAWTGCTGAATTVGRRVGLISGSSISVATAGSKSGVLSRGTSSSPSPHSSAVTVCAATTAGS